MNKVNARFESTIMSLRCFYTFKVSVNDNQDISQCWPHYLFKMATADIFGNDSIVFLVLIKVQFDSKCVSLSWLEAEILKVSVNDN